MKTKLKTIEIQGKPYVTVNARLTYFRENCEDYQLVTEIIKHDDESCLIKASVINKDGVVISTGHAYERVTQGFINKTSHVENCETSAVGRALAIFGIGIDEEVRSYEEMSIAIEGQKTPRKKKEKESACAETETIKKEDLEDLIFKDIETLKDLIELHIALTKEQQNDKDIKTWFSIRKQQLEDEKNG
jgi:hypothetical protein